MSAPFRHSSSSTPFPSRHQRHHHHHHHHHHPQPQQYEYQQPYHYPPLPPLATPPAFPGDSSLPSPLPLPPLSSSIPSQHHPPSTIPPYSTPAAYFPPPPPPSNITPTPYSSTHTAWATTATPSSHTPYSAPPNPTELTPQNFVLYPQATHPLPSPSTAPYPSPSRTAVDYLPPISSTSTLAGVHAPTSQAPPMAAAFPTEPTVRRNTIADLLSTPNEKAGRNSLLCLSQAAAAVMPEEVTPSSSRRRRPSTYRTPEAAAPAGRQDRHVGAPLTVSSLPDDQRRAAPAAASSSTAAAAAAAAAASSALPRSGSLHGPALGVSRSSSKRISRSKSGVATSAARYAAMRAAAASAGGGGPSSAPGSAAATAPASPNPLAQGGGGVHTTTPSPGNTRRQLHPERSLSHEILPALHHTPASDSGDSLAPHHSHGASPPAPTFTPSKAVFHAAARNMSLHAAGRNPMEAMDVDVDAHEPSSSSHDGRPLLVDCPPNQTKSSGTTGTRSKTTPDAKRAQNRESAKRFRVAQKKRWNDLQEMIAERDNEIERLKVMLQELSNQRLATMRSMPAGPSSSSAPQRLGVTSASSDAIALAELDLFRKLLAPRRNLVGGGVEKGLRPMFAAQFGSLYRVLVSKFNGDVFGVRHEDLINGSAEGPVVGGCLWESVHQSDIPQLFTLVVNASILLKAYEGQPAVLSYRRRRRSMPESHRASTQEQEGGEQAEGDAQEPYIRLKGCLYPVLGEGGEIASVILAEFVEI